LTSPHKRFYLSRPRWVWRSSVPFYGVPGTRCQKSDPMPKIGLSGYFLQSSLQNKADRRSAQTQQFTCRPGILVVEYTVH
jgi:hypothetical protein